MEDVEYKATAALVGRTVSAIQGTAIFKIKFGTEVVQVVPNWWYRNGTGGGPEHDIAFRVVPKWTGTETDHPVVPKWSGTERDLPRCVFYVGILNSLF